MGSTFTAYPPGVSVLRKPSDASLIVEACINAKTSAALLYTENLTPHFFDLSSGEAGEILQKLRQYKIRLAVVHAPDTRVSTLWPEMYKEESRTGYFRLFDSAESAREWLSGGSLTRALL